MNLQGMCESIVWKLEDKLFSEEMERLFDGKKTDPFILDESFREELRLLLNEIGKWIEENQDNIARASLVVDRNNFVFVVSSLDDANLPLDDLRERNRNRDRIFFDAYLERSGTRFLLYEQEKV